ncbi:hypothetical protein Ddc_21567 [Ditylenchus destructor]|nr:hypothetical protein Ddc_21567 [Ditylenchus destructor]
MIAFNASGWRAATCKPLKPPQEMPIMPTLPSHPGLPAQPVDHFKGVFLFLQQVLIGHQALGLTVAAHIHPHTHIALPRHPRVGQRIAHGGAVALAVRQVFQDRRKGLQAGDFRQPDACGQLGAVLQGIRQCSISRTV